jgi:hypothetical protein
MLVEKGVFLGVAYLLFNDVGCRVSKRDVKKTAVAEDLPITYSLSKSGRRIT